MDRRQFCLASATVLAVGSAAGVLAHSQTAPSLVIFDSRFAAGRAFAVAAQRRGIATVAIRGDVTALWRQRLNGHWARDGGAVAGLSTRASLLCLEQMARDHWRQLQSRELLAAGLVSWVIARG